MADQPNPENETLGAEPNRETRDEIEKNKAEIKAIRRRVKAEEKAKLKAEKALSETQKALKDAQAKVKRETDSRIKTEKDLTEVQETLSTVRLELEQEREARIEAEKGQTELEKALEEAHNNKTDLRENSKKPLKTHHNEEGTEQRVSFIVRLTVDAHGEPQRTQVEHAQSGNKENFSTLNGKRLTDFMRSCIITTATPETRITPLSSSVKSRVPTPKPSTQTSRLIVSDVQVFHLGDNGAIAWSLNTEEDFVVLVSFQLQGPEAPSLTAEESAYEVKVYANKIASKESKLLATYSGNLVKDDLEYTVQTEVPGLSSGPYSLVTVVTLDPPKQLAGYHEGPIIKVVDLQPSVIPNS